MNSNCLKKIDKQIVERIYMHFNAFKDKKEIRYYNLVLKYLYRLYSVIEKDFESLKKDICVMKSILSLYEIFLYAQKNLFDVYEYSDVFSHENIDSKNVRESFVFKDEDKKYLPLNLKFEKADISHLLDKAVSPILTLRSFRDLNDI